MATTPKKYGGMAAEDFFSRAKAHKLKPTIINESSNFVVITYWWGRGNLNKNTQRPCPEDRQDILEDEGILDYLLEDLRKENPSAKKEDLDKNVVEDELKAVAKVLGVEWKEPIKFEEMIANWESACRKNKCNYLAEEYPEFAVKGGYQHAINFKPYFIDLALQACYPRGVLYIDGDMSIKQYPAICDIPGVDYMARGWNIDPRPRPGREPCFDPYVLETSGGTMFFGNTHYGRRLLKVWEEATLKNPGKADDRILSMAITMKALLTTLTTIQLPIEYLWLDMDYDYLAKKYKISNNESISISHPECLTGEDRAAAEGASSNRYPRAYDRYVSNIIECRKKEVFYEYVFFDSPKTGPFKIYLEWLKKHNELDVIPYSKAYGEHTNKAQKNSQLLNTAELSVKDKIVIVSPQDINTTSLHKITSKELVPSTILKYLLNNQHVVYVPKGTRSVNTVVGAGVSNELDFVTKNVNDSKSKSKKDYTLKLSPDYPIYFSPKNKVLKHLLLMSADLDDFEKVFNSSFIFLTRIHCGWI